MPKKRYTGQGGPNNRRKRYTEPKTAWFSAKAAATLEEMAEKRGTKVGRIIRNATMEKIYIYRDKKEQQALKEFKKERGDETPGNT